MQRFWLCDLIVDLRTSIDVPVCLIRFHSAKVVNMHITGIQSRPTKSAGEDIINVRLPGTE